MVKKLQHFNNREEYIAFLGTDEFAPPDISTIGTGSSETWDVEYNPENMLLIADKKIFEPNDSVLNYTVLSITNGRSNVWWRPSTGGTYTKISNSDLPFYSGYTIGKTNLSVAMPERTTSYNNEYIISAISDASTSISVNTSSKQYGLITLTAPPIFKWEGETLAATVNTAPGNEWEITNIPDWLTFERTTGVGPTSINVTVGENPVTVERQGNVTIGYTNSAVTSYTVISETFRQEKRNAVYFAFDTDLVNIGSGGTNNYQIGYASSGDGTSAQVTLQTDATWVTFVTNPFTSTTSGYITINVGANPDRNVRTAIVNAIISGNVIDTVTVQQEGHELYFYVSTTSQSEALATSATTVYFNITSANTENKIVYYATNYNTEEIGNLTFDTSSFVCGDTTTMTNTGIFTFNMKAKTIVVGDVASDTYPILLVKNNTNPITTVSITHSASAYFKFNQTSVTGVSEDGGTLYNGIETNIPVSSLLLNSVPAITSYNFGTSELEYTIPINTSVTEGVNYTLTSYWGGNQLDSFTVQQNKKIFHVNLKVNDSTSPGNIGSATTLFTISTEPNSSSKTYTIYVNTNPFTSVTGTYTGSYPCGENPDVVERTFTVTSEDESVSITQQPKHLSFIWNDTNTTATTQTVDSGTTNSSKYYTTNYPNLSVTWNGVITSATINEGIVTAYYPVNTGVTPKEGVVEVKSNGVVIGTYTVTQNGMSQSVTLYLNGTHGNITIGSGATTFTIGVNPNSDDFSYKILVNGTTEWNNLTGSTTNTYNCGANPNTTAKTFTVKAESSNASEEFTVTQEAKAYFRWTNGSTAVTETVGSASTSSSKEYTTNYTSLTPSYGGCVTGASINNGTCTVNYTQNPGTSDRTGYVYIMNGSTVVGTYNITQEAKAYLWIISSGQTTASTTNVTSAGTSLSYNILTNYLQSELDGFTATTPDWVNTVKLTNSSSALTFNVDQNPIASESRSGDVLIGGLTVSITQNAGVEFKANLKVNGSTTPGAIGSDTTSFTITTEPNDTSVSYQILVDTSVATTTSGNYSGSYTCGANTGTTERTFTVKCGNETVNIKQRPIPPITYTINGSFGNNSESTITFTVEIYNKTYPVLSKTLMWAVMGGGTITEEKTFNGYVGDEIKVTVSCSEYPATLAFEDATQIGSSEPLVWPTLSIYYRLREDYLTFDAQGERASNNI